MSTQPKGSNGTAAPKPETNGTVKQVSTTVTLKPVKPDDEKATGKHPDLPPIEDRVLKVQQLFDLTTKREKLQTSLKRLNSLDLATENRQLKITIEDGDEEWETHNTDAIKFCVASLRETLQSKVKEVEKLISL